MDNHNTLFYNLTQFVRDAQMRFPDLRLTITFIWAVVGLIISETVHLNQWALFRPGKANAASKERQLSRWLHNERIRPLLVYRPLIKKVLTDWSGQTLYLALDTTLLWNRFVVVRLALVYRGRALPVGWVVCASGSATVAVSYYHRMLAQTAELMPANSRVVLLADRGFVHVELLKAAGQLGWHFRIRIKSNIVVYRATKGQQKVSALMPLPGRARFFSHVWITEQRFGPVHLALAYVQTANGYEKWAVISDEPAGLQTLDEYGLRFDIEENFLDDKSAGFQLESSQIEDAMALSRLCLILAVATLYLVSIGTAVVETGQRRLVDTHWERGLSYLQIGWRWVKRALYSGQRLCGFIWLSPESDPEPAMASRKQFRMPDLHLVSVEWL